MLSVLCYWFVFPIHMNSYFLSASMFPAWKVKFILILNSKHFFRVLQKARLQIPWCSWPCRMILVETSRDRGIQAEGMGLVRTTLEVPVCQPGSLYFSLCSLVSLVLPLCSVAHIFTFPGPECLTSSHCGICNHRQVRGVIPGNPRALCSCSKLFH